MFTPLLDGCSTPCISIELLLREKTHHKQLNGPCLQHCHADGRTCRSPKDQQGILLRSGRITRPASLILPRTFCNCDLFVSGNSILANSLPTFNHPRGSRQSIVVPLRHCVLPARAFFLELCMRLVCQSSVATQSRNAGSIVSRSQRTSFTMDSSTNS